VPAFPQRSRFWTPRSRASRSSASGQLTRKALRARASLEDWRAWIDLVPATACASSGLRYPRIEHQTGWL
jgi:hypothetical protein